MSRILPAFLVLLSLLGGTAVQARDAVVVELFTSQGCSSCPPADEILAELATRNDVYALAYHVDYWDYLGWADEFGSPAFTARQKAYARSKGERSIYTPQAIIGGTDHVVGSKSMKIANAIQRHSDMPDPVTISVRRNGGRVEVVARSTSVFDAPAVVRVVTYIPQATTEIRRGENAGRTITYVNIVSGWRDLGTWSGASEFSGSAEVPAGVPCVVIVQLRETGPILGAARLR